MTPESARDLARTRRHFFSDCGLGLGAMALAAMAGRPAWAEAATDPLAPKPPHFAPKAKAIIYLFMAGGPSQFELFDPKPELQKRHGQPIPESFTAGKRFAFMDSFSKARPKLLGTRRKFRRAGSAGMSVSECLPHTAEIMDDLTFIRTVATDAINHAPAKLFMNTGSAQFGRPSFGSWVTYGLGSESRDLPGFVVLQSGPRGPRGGVSNWGSGFLPTAYQGVPFRAGADPIVDLATPNGVPAPSQQAVRDAIRGMNGEHLAATGDPEIATRVAAYEMAFRMQTSGPELVDLSRETPETLALYGVEPGVPSFGANCLMARRLVERGSRFVQLYHTSWDHHGGPNEDLGKDLDRCCRETDRGAAALVTDLKRRGMLDDTVVVWGGEFGRTPMGEIRTSIGRNHHIDAFPMWLAGAGLKPGVVFGETDEFGFAPTEGRVHVHDLHATLLHLLGLEHTRLTFKSQGRNFRLTDVHGELARGILA